MEKEQIEKLTNQINNIDNVGKILVAEANTLKSFTDENLEKLPFKTIKQIKELTKSIIKVAEHFESRVNELEQILKEQTK